MHALGVQEADAGQIVRYRLAAAGIQGVRIAAPLPVVGVVQVARGGNCPVAQRQSFRGGVGGSVWQRTSRLGDGRNRHTPRLACAALAAGAQLAANFYQAVGQTQGMQALQDGIDGVALGNAAQIQMQATALVPAALGAMLKALPAAAGLRLLYGGWAG